jgi:hypothetical protein
MIMGWFILKFKHCKMILDCFMGIFIWSYNIRYDYIITEEGQKH